MTPARAPVFLAARSVLEAGDRITLDGPEGRHAAKVRRLAVGESVDVVDGAGLRVRCEVASGSGESLVLAVRSREQEPDPSPRVVVVQALAKGDRGERAIEVLTEVGVDEIVPWSAARSVVEWRAYRGTKALERWRSTARESAKQARRAHFPDVSALASTAAVRERIADTRGIALVLDGETGTDLAAVELPSTGEVLLVVGPEGGVSPDELSGFTAVGGVSTRLGPTVLRTSTAGLVAATAVLARTRWTVQPTRSPFVAGRPRFDLNALYSAVERARADQELSWKSLSQEVGVATSTIRRFESAADAEADGVLALVGWLGAAPETFVEGTRAKGDPLPATSGGVIRVDMSRVSAASTRRQSSPSSGRTTIQRLVEVATTAGQPIASFTRRTDA